MISYTHINKLIYFTISLFILTIGVSFYSFTAINTSKNIVIELYQLKSDVLVANIAIRNSAIATVDFDMNRELDKMLVTRSDANKIYDKLSSHDMSHEDSIILSEMKVERKEYRESQLAIIKYIKLKEDDHVWAYMIYYNTFMDRYIQRVDTLLQSQLTYINMVYDNTKTFLFIVFTMIVIVILLCSSFYKKGEI